MKAMSSIALMFVTLVLSGCDDPDAVPDKKIGAFAAEERGYVVPEGVALGSAGKPVWMKRVIVGYDPIRVIEKPKSIDRLPVSKTCDIAKPSGDAAFHFIHLEESGRQIPIYTAGSDDVAHDVSRLVEAYERKAPEPIALEGGQAQRVVDVFVTEKDKPVYLVLTSQQATIWNIQAEPGVRFERIVLLSRNVAGIANVDDSVPVQAFNRQMLKRCKIEPAREPLDHWALYRNARQSPAARKAVDKNYLTFRRFSGWFFETFGITASTHRVSPNRADHILIGDVPETLEGRLNYQPVAETNLKLTAARYMFVDGKKAYKSDYRKVVLKKAEAVAGVDLSELAHWGQDSFM